MGWLLKISNSEWDKAEQYFRNNPNKVKFSKKWKLGRKYSFINVDNVIYAVKNGEVLGEGGFGKVKLIQNKEGENFALKIEGIRNESDMESRKSGIKIMQAIKFCRAYVQTEYGKEYKDEYAETKLYSILEYKEGKDLSEHLSEFYFDGAMAYDRPQLSIEDKLIFAIKAGECVKDLHGRGFIHADIKPANFMASTKNGVVVVSPIDFNLSKISENGKFVQSDKVSGTEGYIAPEIIADGHYSTASDVYAFGCMLRDNFKFNFPFINKLLAEKPENRPSMAEAVKELQQALKNQKNLSPKAQELLKERETPELEADLKKARDFEDFCRIIENYKGELKTSKGEPIDKNLLIQNMKEIMSNPELVKGIVSNPALAKETSPELGGTAHITNNFKIHDKFVEFVKKQAAQNEKSMAFDKMLNTTTVESLTKTYQYLSESHTRIVGGLYNMAKSASKSITGKGVERDRQIKEISDLFKILQNNTNLPKEEKAKIALAYLTHIQQSIDNESGNVLSSGMTKLCQGLKDQVKRALPTLPNMNEKSLASYQKKALELMKGEKPQEQVQQRTSLR